MQYRQPRLLQPGGQHIPYRHHVVLVIGIPPGVPGIKVRAVIQLIAFGRMCVEQQELWSLFFGTQRYPVGGGQHLLYLGCRQLGVVPYPDVIPPHIGWAVLPCHGQLGHRTSVFLRHLRYFSRDLRLLRVGLGSRFLRFFR